MRRNSILPLLLLLIVSRAFSAVEGTVYFTGQGINRCNLDGTNVQKIVDSGSISEVALDVPNEKVYWCSSSTSWGLMIRRCNLDGSNVEDIIRPNWEPFGLAVGGGKVYWSEISSRPNGKIRRCNLDGSAVENLLTGLDQPWAIALDLTNEKIYWGSGKNSGKISRCNLDGSNVENLITTGLIWPHGIALDVHNGKMYWVNWGLDMIQRANLDGSNIETLISFTDNPLVENPAHIDLDLVDRKMYWTDQVGAGKVQRANLDGQDYEVITEGYAPFGIAVYHIPEPVIEAVVDIKPGSCPNPLNVKSKGILPVAILGTEDLDVTEIDVASIQLAGVDPNRSNYEDVFGPGFDANDCNCTESGPDGYLDLTLKFETQMIVEAIGEVNHGDELVLELTGVLSDETPIEGSDCIIIRGKHKPLNRADFNGDGIVDMADFAAFAENWLQLSIVEY